MDEAARWRLIAKATPHLHFVEARVLASIHLLGVEMEVKAPVLSIGEIVEAAGSSRRMILYALASLRDRGLISSRRVRIAGRLRPRRYRIDWTRLAEHSRDGVL